MTVVRPGQLQHPFADALWHQIVDDDDDDEPEYEGRSSPPTKDGARGRARSDKSSRDHQRGPAEPNTPPDKSSADAENYEEIHFEDDLFDAPSEENLFRDSDDWSDLDGPDDENEAA